MYSEVETLLLTCISDFYHMTSVKIGSTLLFATSWSITCTYNIV